MNKYQESLDRLMCNVGVIRSNYRRSGKAKEDYKNLKRLVDKRTPKKWEYDEFLEWAICPVCGNHWDIMDNDVGTFNFCPNCGQRLDWSDVDENS